MVLTSCLEEVVIDDLNNVQPKLVIEAGIQWDKNNPSLTQTQTIKISQSSSYYNNTYAGITGATINVFDKNNVSMGTFIDQNNGTYVATNFTKPTIGDTYTLEISLNGKLYTASEVYTDIVDINKITQETTFFPTESIQVNVNIDNEIGVNNYYLYKGEFPFRKVPEYNAFDDLNISEEPGKNNTDITLFNSEFKAGEKIDITLYGISKQYKNFLFKVITLSQGASGPFSTAPATVQGNILNNNNKNNNPLGYFSLSQFVKTSYTIQ